MPAVLAVCDPREYDSVLEELRRGDGVSLAAQQPSRVTTAPRGNSSSYGISAA
jgi:hypothetical protein